MVFAQLQLSKRWPEHRENNERHVRNMMYAERKLESWENIDGMRLHRPFFWHLPLELHRDCASQDALISPMEDVTH